MTLGEKIKKARKDLKLTQAQLCNDKITRNMLSSIERNKATPSLETIKFIANRLDIPVGYLFSEDDDLLYYEKQSRIERIKSAFLAKNYKIQALSSIYRQNLFFCISFVTFST